MALVERARVAASLGTRQKRGVTIAPRCGVVKLGADGPARRSSSLSPVVAEGTTANSLATSCPGPQQDDQIVKTKPPLGELLGNSGSEPEAFVSPFFEEPAARAAQHVLRACSRVGWTSPPTTSNTAHFTANTRSGR